MERRSRRPCSGLGLSSVNRWALGDEFVEGESDIVEHVRLVALDGEQPEEIGGQRALGEQGIGGDGAPAMSGTVSSRGRMVPISLVASPLRRGRLMPIFFAPRASWSRGRPPSTCAWWPSSSMAPRSALPSMARAVSPEPWAWCQARRAASSWAGSTRMSTLRERLGGRCWPLPSHAEGVAEIVDPADRRSPHATQGAAVSTVGSAWRRPWRRRGSVDGVEELGKGAHLCGVEHHLGDSMRRLGSSSAFPARPGTGDGRTQASFAIAVAAGWRRKPHARAVRGAVDGAKRVGSNVSEQQRVGEACGSR